MKKLLSFLITAVFMLSIIPVSTVVLTAQDRESKVDTYVYVIAATDYISPRLNGIAQGVKADINMTTDWLQAIEDIEVANVHLEILKGRKATYDNTVRVLKNSKADSNDIVMVFLSSHGGMNNGKRYYVLCDEETTLWRKDLVNIVNSIGARFNFISTDACSAGTEAESFENVMSATPWHSTLADEKQIAAYRSLLNDYKGTLEMTAASRLQYAFTAYNGGYYSQALFDTLNKVKSKTTWNEITDITIEKTKEIFKKSYEQGYLDHLKPLLRQNSQTTQKPEVLQKPHRFQQEEIPDEEDRDDEPPFVGPVGG